MNKSKTILAMLLLTTLTLWQLASAQQAAPNVQTLRGADTAEKDQAPDEKPNAGKDPGSQKRITRTFAGQPPLIPHTVESLDSITLDGNSCLSCHGPDNYKYANAPKVGNSHFLDRDGKKLADVSPRRHECTACHIPQTDAKPLVQNTFKSAVTPKKK